MVASLMYQLMPVKKLVRINLCTPGAHFLKDPETFHVHRAIFSSSVFKNGGMHLKLLECMKQTSVQIKNILNHKVRDFPVAFQV